VKDQDADRAAIGRYRRDVILGAACLRPNQHAQDRFDRLSSNETKIAPRSAENAAKYRQAAGAAQAAESIGPATRQLDNQGYRYAAMSHCV
jgi:hypothetical protein